MSVDDRIAALERQLAAARGRKRKLQARGRHVAMGLLLARADRDPAFARTVAGVIREGLSVERDGEAVRDMLERLDAAASPPVGNEPAASNGQDHAGHHHAGEGGSA